jgi:hypothetical protein
MPGCIRILRLYFPFGKSNSVDATRRYHYTNSSNGRSVVKSCFRLAAIAILFGSSLTWAREFVPGFYSYVIEVKDPEGVRVPQKICVSLLRKDEKTLGFYASDASKYENCIDEANYSKSGGVMSTGSLYDASKIDEVGILKNKEGVESRWTFWKPPTAHILKLKDEKGGDEKTIAVCSVPITREEDKSRPEVASKIYTEVDPRFLRIEFCESEPLERTWLKDASGKLVERLVPRCPTAKVCLEQKRIKIEAKIVTTPDASTAHTNKGTTNQQVHNGR